MQISVLGLGKVGLSFASCLTAAGHEVWGADPDAALVDALTRRAFQTSEPGVLERLTGPTVGGFTATADSGLAVRNSDITFVVVPTPSNTLGGFSLRYVLRACDEIGAALVEKRGEHTVAMVSTLLPGSSDAVVMPRLEQASRKTIGSDLGYCYNPSFIALGEVIDGIERPDYLLIGQSDRRAGDVVLAVHRSMVKTDSPVARMAPIEAEITKVASNTHETMRVSFANMLFSICNEVPGADVDRITEALAHRMGRRFFKGATPYGGPCWPRDNQAFSLFIDAIRAANTLPRAVDTFNAEHGRYILRKVLEISSTEQTVGLLGLAYKPGTPVIDRSFAVNLAEWLLHEGRTIVGWDPLALDEVRRVFGDRIRYAATPEECLSRSDVTVVVNALPELAVVDWTAARDRTVVDCWRCLPAAAIAPFGQYVPLGRGPNADVGEWLEKTAGDFFRLLTS